MNATACMKGVTVNMEYGIFLHLPLPSLAQLSEFPKLDFINQFLGMLNTETNLITITITITDSISISININMIK